MAPRAPARIIRANGARRRAVPTRISTARTSTAERCDVPFGRRMPAICLIPRRCHDQQRWWVPVRLPAARKAGQANGSSDSRARNGSIWRGASGTSHTGSAVPTICAVCAADAVCTAHTARTADAAHRSGHDATVLAAIPGCGCRTSTTAGGSHAASSIRNTNRRCARPAAIRLGSGDAKLPPGGTDSAGDASGTGDIACFGSFKRRDTSVPAQSGRAACGRCRGNTSIPA